MNTKNIMTRLLASTSLAATLLAVGCSDSPMAPSMDEGPHPARNSGADASVASQRTSFLLPDFVIRSAEEISTRVRNRDGLLVSQTVTRVVVANEGGQRYSGTLRVSIIAIGPEGAVVEYRRAQSVYLAPDGRATFDFAVGCSPTGAWYVSVDYPNEISESSETNNHAWADSACD